MSLSIDETDARIIKLLQEDARMPLRELSIKLSMSIPTIRKRIARLQELGIIKKFVALVDYSKIKENIIIFLTIDSQPSEVSKIAESLKEYPEVLDIYILSGEHNILAKVVSPDIMTLQNLIKDISNNSQITKIKSSMVTEVVKEEISAKIMPGSGIKVNCAYCGKIITGKPYTLTVDSRTYFFCCKTCLSEFKEKYHIH